MPVRQADAQKAAHLRPNQLVLCDNEWVTTARSKREWRVAWLIINGAFCVWVVAIHRFHNHDIRCGHNILEASMK